MAESSPSLSRRGFLRGGLATTAAAVASRLAPPGAASAADPAPAAPPGAGGLESVAVSTEVNGAAVTRSVHPDESAIGLLRGPLGLTGSKLSCGHGACGACSIHLDGAPVAACLLPATALEGRKVTTIEGVSRALHPVQKAFMAEDALQCGYCTPGFVMAAIPFVDRWRSEHPGAAPDAQTIASALGGHLCRCGAYPAIYKAVQGACAGRYDGEAAPPARVEALAKVTGAARYTVDVRLPEMLEAKILRSPHAHADIKAIRTQKAQALPGVLGVHVLTEVGRKVRFAGQEIAAVAAVDEQTAAQALRLIEVDYELRPAVTSAAAARKEGAAIVYPKGDRNPSNAAEGMMMRLPWEANVRGPTTLGQSDPKDAHKAIAAARERGEGLYEGVFTSHVQCHTALEPHSCVARWDGPEKLTLYISTQAVSHIADDVAERWGLKRANVQVLCEHTGGGFGAKNRIGQETIAAIELARATGRPVRAALERAEELTTGGLRPGSEVHVSLATGEDHALVATLIQSWHDGGTAVGQNTGIFFRLMYPSVAHALEDYDVVSHAPPGEPLRAPGGPNAFWALEQAVDDIAHRLKVDPLELRRRWDTRSARVPLYDWVAGLEVWKQRGERSADKGRHRRGVGLATGAWFHMVQGDTQVEVQASPAGVVARCAVQDMGNGARTVLAEVVSQVLGMKPAEIEVQLGDSSLVRGPMSGGSRTTASIGPAARTAATQLRDALLEATSERLKLTGATVGQGGIDHQGGHLPWAEVLKLTPELRFIGRRSKDPDGYFLPIPIAGLSFGKRLSGAAVVMEVEVDTRLGRVRATRSWAGMNIGAVYTPTLARSQVLGGVVQGVSYALYEDRRLDPPTGRLVSAGLEDYRIMGLGDSPEIEVHFHPDSWDGIHGGGVGLGELATISTAGAVGNAVFHATGWRPTTMPLRPDVILQGVKV